MIDLYYWPTPNGHKITLFLEETGLAYRILPVNIGKGEQFQPEFLAIAPNNRMPAIIDHAPADGAAPLSVFESGAILLYLAEKTGRLLPAEPRARIDALQWLFWQMGGLGPMGGQANHFRNYASEKIPYAVDRYSKEVERLFAVLDHRLADREFIAGEYSIADIASYPWVAGYEKFGLDLVSFPHLARWYASIKARRATGSAYALGPKYNPAAGTPPSEAERRILFGQGADVVRR